MESLVKFSALECHSLPAKVVLSWPSNDISKVSELLIWESLEKVLCSARIPRASLNGVSLLEQGNLSLSFHLCLITASVNLDFHNVVDSALNSKTNNLPPPLV